MMAGRGMRHTVVSRLILALSVAVGLAATAAHPARANISMLISPSLVELSAAPGGTGSTVLVLTNRGDEPFDATASVATIESAPSARSAVSWLRVEPATFRVTPGRAQDLKVAVAVPADLASGGYYALVTVTTGAKSGEGATVGVAGQLGVAFLITVRGDGELTEQASLPHFAPFFETDGRIGFRAVVESTGNVHADASGKVEIVDAAGKHVASLDVPSAGRVLPGSSRVLQALGSVPLPPGSGFHADATFTYGTKQQKLSAGASFTVGAPPVHVADVSVCENMDTGPTVSFRVEDGGELGVEPPVSVIVQEQSGAEVANAAVAAPLLWPRSSADVRVELPRRLVSGQYVLTVTARVGPGKPVARQVPFRIGGVGGQPVPLCSSRGATMTPAA